MKDQLTETYGFLKTTAIGGLIFLLPLAVVGGLLGYVYNVVLVTYPDRQTLGLARWFSSSKTEFSLWRELTSMRRRRFANVWGETLGNCSRPCLNQCLSKTGDHLLDRCLK